jgi:hypothetical protein
MRAGWAGKNQPTLSGRFPVSLCLTNREGSGACPARLYFAMAAGQAVADAGHAANDVAAAGAKEQEEQEE